MSAASNSNDLHRSEIDAYGFKHGDSFDYDSYEEFMSKYLSVLARRARKWDTLLNGTSKVKRSGKVKRYVRKGIPNEHRGEVWMSVSKAQKMMKQNEGLYQRLLEQEIDSNVQTEIDIDLHRTFPENIYFANDASDGKQTALRNVLIAFANHNPDIGYCQGLNYVVGMMLIVLKDEEKTFFLLEKLTKQILVGYYSRNLRGLNVDQLVLGELIKLKHPTLAKHMEDKLVPWSLVCMKWFVCLYLDILPIETTLRVWDCLFYEGPKILFRVALTLVLQNSETILTARDSSQIVDTFKSMTSQPKNMECHQFMQKVFLDSQPLKMATIEKLRSTCEESL